MVGWGFDMTYKKDRRGWSQPVGTDRRLRPDDRRRFPRVLINLEVDYGHEDTFLFAYITDISAMGIFVQTHTPEPEGTRLNLRFSPPGWGRAMELEGEVIWVNPYRPGDRENLNPGMGIKFVDLTDEQRLRLTELVRTFAYLAREDDEEDNGRDGATGGEDLPPGAPRKPVGRA